MASPTLSSKFYSDLPHKVVTYYYGKYLDGKSRALNSSPISTTNIRESKLWKEIMLWQKICCICSGEEFVAV